MRIRSRGITAMHRCNTLMNVCALECSTGIITITPILLHHPACVAWFPWKQVIATRNKETLQGQMYCLQQVSCRHFSRPPPEKKKKKKKKD